MTSTNNGSVLPRLRSTHVPRPRIATLLSEIPDFLVTVIKAGAGYGKTTAIGHYVQQCQMQYHWLTVREEDRFGTRFVERTLEMALPADVPAFDGGRIVDAAHSPLTWLTSARLTSELIATYVHDETIYVIDDFHVVDEDSPILQWVETWVRHLPPNIHVVFVSRTSPAVPMIEQLATRGEVLWVRERDLAFTEPEVGFLFQDSPVAMQRHRGLDRDQTRWLVGRTGGMAMALSMLLRDWRQHGSFARLQEELDEHTSIQEQVGRLFVQNLSPEHKEFLQNTCVFHALHPELCNQALGRQDSARLLMEMERKGCLMKSIDEAAFELPHPLVRDFLAKSLAADDRERLLEQAFAWHQSRHDESRAIPYLFLMQDESRVVEALFTYIPAYLERGKVSTVQGWLDRISPKSIAHNAGLLIAKAEVARHTNHFAMATECYDAAYAIASAAGDAEMLAQVEMGRARLFLDTIQPAPATIHIRTARSYVGRENRKLRYQILQLTFENSINQGRIHRATRLQQVLTGLDGASLPNNNSDVRLLLRRGRLNEVISKLKPRVSTDLMDGRNALSHREGALLLSLMYAMSGEAHKAKEQALRGHLVGHSLSAPFVSAVGYIRLGHAEHLLDPLGDEALSSYQEAVGDMDDMDVPRGKSEALLGLCLSHGYRKQFGLARAYAKQGEDIAMAAGDTWMAMLVRAGFGQVAVVNDLPDVAVEALCDSIEAFERIGDAFLATACRLWRCYAWHQLGDNRWQDELEQVLFAVELNDWAFLLQRPTLCGVRDLQTLVPLLQDYRGEGAGRRLALRYLHELQRDAADHHPGYTLRVQTFGRFAVWRGFTEITRRDWQREKARQLFQFFLTHRNVLMHREEICERLWGDIDGDAAERDFKVALNVLSNAIEPNKPGRGTSSFIVRQGSLYGLIHHNMLSIDRDDFVRLIHEAESESDNDRRLALLAQAMELYQGDYLQDIRYETWSDAEREKLRLLFIQAATEYAKQSFAKQRYSVAIAACERVLEIEPTFEDAYEWLMKTYAAQYNRAMVVQTYRTCERVLLQELGIEPMATTKAVYEAMLLR